MQKEYVNRFYKIINKSFCSLSFARQYSKDWIYIFVSFHINANNVAERLRKMSIRFSVVIHSYNVLSHSWD